MDRDPDLSAAVVGCGGAGANHARGYDAADGAALAAVCDVDAERAASLADDYGVPWYEDLDAMLSAVAPDVVSVATPEHRHREPTATALSAGANVLCEKIMAATLADGRAMVEAAAGAPGVLGVDYNYRHMPTFERLAAAVGAGGDLGEPSLVTVDTHAFAWHHSLDLLRYLLGEPTGVTATLSGGSDDRFEVGEEVLYVPERAVAATFDFPDCVAGVTASLDDALDEHLIDVAVYGEGGRAGVDGITTAGTTGRPAPGPLADDLRDLPATSLDDAFVRSVGAFVDAVRAGERPPTTGTDGLRAMEMEAAVVEAAREDRRVDVRAGGDR
jgi:predicted dehydrogenase